jgi:hypothetical protein
LAGLTATAWSPAVAEEYTADDTLARTLPAASTPAAEAISSPSS